MRHTQNTVRAILAFRYDWSNSYFASETCRDESIVPIDGIDLFLCFTIGAKPENLKKISALSAILYLHDFARQSFPFYPPLFSIQERAARGARVYVHEAGTYPDINRGFDVSPGTNVLINLKSTVIKRLHEPYETCTDRRLLDDSDAALGGNAERYTYTTDAAIARCQQLHTMNSCGCYSPRLPLTPQLIQLVANRGMTSCYKIPSNLDDMTSDVINQTLANIDCFQSLSFAGHCDDFETPCTEKKFSFQHFETAWPHETYEYAFYDTFIASVDPRRRAKFDTYFDSYVAIGEELDRNTRAGLQLLRDEDLIERNFIQISLRYQVRAPDFSVLQVNLSRSHTIDSNQLNFTSFRQC